MEKIIYQSNVDFIQVEDFDGSTDTKFVKDQLLPYLKDLFKDLHLRCNKDIEGEKCIDKATFIEYC